MPFSIRPEGAPKTNPSTKAEVEDGEIEDAKMTDVAMKGTEKAAKSKQEPSEKAEKAPQQAEPSAAGPETAKEPIPSEKPAPEPAAEPTSHAQPSPAPAASQPEVQPEEQGKQAEASRRPEHERAPSSSNTRPLPNRPFRQGDGRLPNRPDFVDDRRPRHPDHSRSFDSTTGDGRGYGPFERTYPPDRFQTIRPVVLRIVMVDFPRSLIGLTDMDACVHHRMLFMDGPKHHQVAQGQVPRHTLTVSS